MTLLVYFLYLAQNSTIKALSKSGAFLEGAGSERNLDNTAKSMVSAIGNTANAASTSTKKALNGTSSASNPVWCCMCSAVSLCSWRFLPGKKQRIGVEGEKEENLSPPASPPFSLPQFSLCYSVQYGAGTIDLLVSFVSAIKTASYAVYLR